MNCQRTIWIGKDLKDHLVLPPWHRQGQLPLDQVAQSPIQCGLEDFQGWAATASLGNLFHSHPPPVNNSFLILKTKHIFFPFETIAPCPVTACSCEKSLSSSGRCSKICLVPLLQAEQPQFSQQKRNSSPLIILSLLWTCFHNLMSSLW